MQFREIISIFLAEFLGTGILIFVGCSSCLSLSGYKPTKLDESLTFGIVIMFVVNIFVSSSGGHINPAITIATVVNKMVSPARALVYISGQILGSILGFGLLESMIPRGHKQPGLCTIEPHPGLSPIMALSWEFVMTSVLLLFCCSLWDHRNSQFTDSLMIRLGLTVTGLIMSGGLLSGSSMNPARVLGPALWKGKYELHWVYWVGPILSSLVIPPFYQFFFGPRKTAEEATTVDEETISKETA